MSLTEVHRVEGPVGPWVAVAPSGRLWADATTNFVQVWRRGPDPDVPVQAVRISGYVAGRPVFGADDLVTVGVWSVDPVTGVATSRLGAGRWRSAGIDPDLSLVPDQFSAPFVAHGPALDRAVVRTEFQRSRGLERTPGRRSPSARLLLVDLDADRLVATLSDAADLLGNAIDVTGDVVAAAEGSAVSVWDVRSGDRRGSWTAPGHVESLAVHPVDAQVATLGRAGEIEVRSADGVAVAAWSAHESRGQAVVWSPGKGWLASGARSGEVSVWSLDGDAPTLLGTRVLPAVGGLAAGPPDLPLLVVGDAARPGASILDVA